VNNGWKVLGQKSCRNGYRCSRRGTPRAAAHLGGIAAAARALEWIGAKQMALQNLRDDSGEISGQSGRGAQRVYHDHYRTEGPAGFKLLTRRKCGTVQPQTGGRNRAGQLTAKRIDEIGPVNLVAIEEYEETEQLTSSSAPA